MVDRVVSLAPSATVSIRHIGRGDVLVGQTNHCPGDTYRVGDWLAPDIDAIEDLEPDLVVTTDALQDRIVDEITDRGIDTAHFTPATLEDVLAYIRQLGTLIDASAAGDQLVEDLEHRLERVRRAVEDTARPVVYAEEWQDPPMAAGNWVPDAIRIAGGTYPFRDPGERSAPIDRETVERAQPHTAILHICGSGDDVNPDSLEERGWDIPAVRRHRVYVLSDEYLNQPSPHLITGVERIASILHPSQMSSHDT